MFTTWGYDSECDMLRYSSRDPILVVGLGPRAMLCALLFPLRAEKYMIGIPYLMLPGQVLAAMLGTKSLRSSLLNLVVEL